MKNEIFIVFLENRLIVEKTRCVPILRVVNLSYGFRSKQKITVRQNRNIVLSVEEIKPLNLI